MGTRRQLRSNEDVKTTGQSSEWFDLGDESLNGLVASVYAKTLSGGTDPTLVFTVEHSPDKVAIYPLEVNPTELIVAGAGWSRRVPGPLFRYARFSWVTTGSPTTADFDLFIDA